MFKKNNTHLQPLLISNNNDLAPKQRLGLEQSWAGTFYQELFCRINEEAFAGLYADVPSRPNIPVNVLVGLETLKSGFGWSDEEMYDHFLYDLQVRYAVGYHQFGAGEFELGSVCNFRQRLSRYNQEQGVNVLVQVFEDISDQQIQTLEVRTGQQRMDSTQVASNILEASRLQLLVEAIQGLERILNEADQERLAGVFAPYLKGRSGQYVYRVKGMKAYQEHLQAVGQTMNTLIKELRAEYAQEAVWQMFERFFSDNYHLKDEAVHPKGNDEIGSGCLQFPDDLEATYRQKNGQGYKGYVANLTETCDPKNDLQLITQVQVGPNNTDDADLLVQALPNLVERTDLSDLYSDGGFGNPEADVVLQEKQVALVQSRLRGKQPDPERYNLADFDIHHDQAGNPLEITCPNGQTVPVEPGRKNGYLARFDRDLCRVCPFQLHGRCRATPGKRRPQFQLNFTLYQVNGAKRRRRHLQAKDEKDNRRVAVEASVRSLKHPFGNGKLPVRGRFRMTCMLLDSASMVNLWRMWKYQQRKEKQGDQKSGLENLRMDTVSAQVDLFLSFFQKRLLAFRRSLSALDSCFNY